MADKTGPAELETLLPFWVNGSLSDAEKSRVEEALGESPALQKEARILKQMRETLKADGEDIRGPGEFGLARLNRDLDKEAQPVVAPRGRARGAIWALGSALAASLATLAFVGTGTAPEPFYEQASGEAAGLVITFAPDATISAIAALVRDHGLTIEDGPSAMGLFRLTFLPGETISLETLAEKLYRDDRVVRVDIEE